MFLSTFFIRLLPRAESVRLFCSPDGLGTTNGLLEVLFKGVIWATAADVTQRTAEVLRHPSDAPP
jgi:hypothetical protein